MGAPDILVGDRRAPAHARAAGDPRGAHRGRAPGGRVRARRPARCRPTRSSQPPPRLTPRALVVLEERLRADAAETIEFMREQQVDLKLISGDARSTVTAVAYAIGVTGSAGVIEGPQLPDDRGKAWARWRRGEHDLLPHHARAEEGAGLRAGRSRALHGDDRRRRERRARAEAGPHGGGDGLRVSQITKGVADIVLLKDQFSMLPRAVGEGRRIARNIHRLGRLYMTKSVYAASPDRADLGARLHLPLPAPAPDDRRLPHDRHPLVRPRARSERGTALPGHGCCRSLAAFAVPAGVGTAVGVDALVLLRRRARRRHRRGGPDRRDDHADRARPLLHPPARARAGPRAHHDPDLHARDDRRPRRALRG